MARNLPRYLPVKTLDCFRRLLAIAGVTRRIDEIGARCARPIQLSHNAIAGQDDPSVLKSLYDELDFAWKEYSALSDEAFDIKDLDCSVLKVDTPFYEELHISFLPGDAVVFRSWLEKIAKSKTAVPRMVGRYEDFRLFFDTLVAVKEAKGVVNTAVALRLMAELAGKQLAIEEK